MLQEELLKLFKEKAEAVGTVTAEVENIPEAFRCAIAVTLGKDGSTIAASGLGERDLGILQALCRESGLTLLTEGLRDHLGGIHTGLTIADRGIAETGTLFQDSSSEDVRIATMLSETHIAILPLSRILPDSMALEEEMTQLMRGSPPRYLSFISGASRTADIERVLTIGVHGPRKLRVLIPRNDE